MGRIYTAEVDAQAALVADGDFTFLEVTAPSDAAVIILSGHVGQTTREGDAASEMLPVQLVRFGAGGNGSAVTPRPHSLGDAAFGGTCEKYATVPGTTPVVLWSRAWNIQGGWNYQPPPREMFEVSPSGIFGILIPTAIAVNMTLYGHLTFEAIGG